MKSVSNVAWCVGAVLAPLVVFACGDDDASDSSPTTTADGGTLVGDASSPTPSDAAPAADAGASDAAAASFAAIRPRSTTRLANAINPYGLLWAKDGSLFAAGATIDGGTRKLAVWRFVDGALDTTFGTAGVVTTDLTGDESSFDLVEVGTGSFVVQASAGGNVYLVKLAKDAGGAYAFGAPTFVRFGWDEGEPWPVGTPNAPATPPSYSSWGIALDTSVAASPKIVVFAHGAPAKVADAASQRVDADRWITRVSADTLAFDTTFHGGTPYSVDADGKGFADNARRGSVLADGSIVSSGYTSFGQGLGNHVVLVRLLATGQPDPAFGFGTTAPTPGQTKINPFVAVGGFAEAYAVAQEPSGRYVTTGYGTSNFDVPSKSVDLVALRVKPDGLDTTFGRLGAVAVQSEADKGAGLGTAPHTERGRDLVALADGRTVHAGVYDDYATLFVLDGTGKLDVGSGDDGLLRYNYPAGFFKVARSADGKRIAASAQSLNQTSDAGAPLGSIVVTLDVGP